MNDDDIRAEVAGLREQIADVIRTEIDPRRRRIEQLESMLDGPRVQPVLCYMRHFSYEEEEAMDTTVDEAFSEMDGAEEYGAYSGIGVRVGGYLITKREWGVTSLIRDDIADQQERLHADHMRLKQGITTANL